MFFIAKLTYGCVTFTLSIIFLGWYTYDDIWRFQHERLNDPGHSILVRKSYNFARYLNLAFTDLENIANLLFQN
jgi:hypothetical protein